MVATIEGFHCIVTTCVQRTPIQRPLGHVFHTVILSETASINIQIPFFWLIVAAGFRCIVSIIMLLTNA